MKILCSECGKELNSKIGVTEVNGFLKTALFVDVDDCVCVCDQCDVSDDLKIMEDDYDSLQLKYNEIVEELDEANYDIKQLENRLKNVLDVLNTREETIKELSDIIHQFK